jgi:hypothetical protein
MVSRMAQAPEQSNDRSDVEAAYPRSTFGI